MAERTEQLAKAFEQANAEFIALVEGLTVAQWSAPVASEHRTVAITAHHAATSLVPTVGAASLLANSQALPLTREMLDQGAIQHAHEHANATKAEVLGILHDGGKTAADMIRAWSDDQLDNSGAVTLMGGQVMPCGQFAQFVVVGHLTEHGNNIKAALGT
jgi:hypothetical protein